MLALFSVSISFAQDLEKHQWKNRLVSIMSSNIKSKLFNKQIATLTANINGLKERKTIVYKIIPNHYELTHNNGSWITDKNFYDRFKKTKNTFEVILIGLDGGVKLRQNEVLTIKKLFTLIDGMPMRQSEMKNRN